MELSIGALTASAVGLFGSGLLIGWRLGGRLLGAAATSALARDGGDSMEKEEEASFSFKDEIKMVLVVRMDLKMGKGKVAAQCGHATLGCYQKAMKKSPKILRAWEWSGQAKVCLKCDSEDEMVAMVAKAGQLKLPAYFVTDAGRTQIAAGSRTVLGILGPSSEVNKITGHLKLL
mmetsp:Transcript_7598/g.19668  ORF Transcript_7598/g.19668 Transcript_7598/m.19668 type:complete len:175 (+) Transcript_7598:75-599(+)